jgi:hypothetical protein
MSYLISVVLQEYIEKLMERVYANNSPLACLRRYITLLLVCANSLSGQYARQEALWNLPVFVYPPSKKIIATQKHLKNFATRGIQLKIRIIYLPVMTVLWIS